MENKKKSGSSGAERLFARMVDREYAEMADLPEDKIYEDEDAVFDPEEAIDETKDTDVKGR